MISVTYSTGSSAGFLNLGDQALDAFGQFPTTFAASFPPPAALAGSSVAGEDASPALRPVDAVADALDLAKSLQPSPQPIAVRYAQIHSDTQSALAAARVTPPSPEPTALVPTVDIVGGRSRQIELEKRQHPAPTALPSASVQSPSPGRLQPVGSTVKPDAEAAERPVSDQAAPLDAPFLRARAVPYNGVELAKSVPQSVLPTSVNEATVVDDEPVDPAPPSTVAVPLVTTPSGVLIAELSTARASGQPEARSTAVTAAKLTPADDSRSVQTAPDLNKNVAVAPPALRHIFDTTQLELDVSIVNLTASVTLPDTASSAPTHAEKVETQGDHPLASADLPASGAVDPATVVLTVPVPPVPVDVPVSPPAKALNEVSAASRGGTVTHARKSQAATDAMISADGPRLQAGLAPAVPTEQQPASSVVAGPPVAAYAAPGDRPQLSGRARNLGVPSSITGADNEPRVPTAEPKPATPVTVAAIVRPADPDLKNSPIFSQHTPASDRPEPIDQEATPAPVFNQRLSVVERPVQSDPLVSAVAPRTETPQPGGDSLPSLRLSVAPAPLPADLVAVLSAATAALVGPTIDTTRADERTDEQVLIELEEPTQALSFGRDAGTGLQRAEQSAGVLLTGAQPSGAERHLDLARQEVWLDQLAKDIVAARQDNSRLSFRLSPENLGRLDVDLIRSEAGLSVNMTASTAEASAAITSAQPRLVEELKAQGTRVVETQVRTSDAASTGSNPQSQRNGQNAEYAPFLRTAGATASPDQADEPTRDSDRFA